MTRLILSVLVLTGVTVTEAAEFAAPVRLSGGGQAVRVESPGYAAPCWADVDGDGKKDLLVGQFNNGKIRVYRNLGGNKLAAGQWLKAEGQVAEVPGVW
ncbi:MAG: VCBS repeat-containing protein [Planctomycetota bacterium]|nr:VCBS repeat-containing protein [Planctomycetota bacterium]